MNYTPNELQNLTFRKSFVGGYSEDQVNEVLDKIIEDYTLYIHENIELKDRLAVLNEGIQHYKNIEESLQNTLLIAQQTGEDIKKNAYEKADNIIRDAEIRAQQIIAEANQSIVKVKSEYEDLRKRLNIFRSKAEALLVSQMEMLKHMDDDRIEKNEKAEKADKIERTEVLDEPTAKVV